MAKSLTQRAREKANRAKSKTLESVLEKGSEPRDVAEETDFREVNAGEGKGEAISRDMETAVIPVDQERDLQLADFTDGLPFEKGRIAQRILSKGKNIVEDMISIGKDLIWAKSEMVGHGEFLKYVEEDLNMSHQRASEFMRVAHRVIESKVPHLRQFLLQSTGKSKRRLLALLDVSDEEVTEVMKTETFRGKHLDEVEAMSYRQLQEALLKEKAHSQKVSKRRDEMERKLDEMAIGVEKGKVSDVPPNDTAFDILDRALHEVIRTTGILFQVAVEYTEEYGDEALMEAETKAKINSFLGQISGTVTDIRSALIPDQIDGMRVHIPHVPPPDPDLPAAQQADTQPREQET